MSGLRLVRGGGGLLRLVTAATVAEHRVRTCRALEGMEDPADRARLRATADEVEERFRRSALGSRSRLKVVRS